jgi:hypothetical protein
MTPLLEAVLSKLTCDTATSSSLVIEPSGAPACGDAP